MFRIHAAHYDSDEATFRADLAKKSWVIQIFDEARTLRGFCTKANHRPTALRYFLRGAETALADRERLGAAA
jgi:hypothetical protein